MPYGKVYPSVKPKEVSLDMYLTQDKIDKSKFRLFGSFYPYISVPFTFQGSILDSINGDERPENCLNGDERRGLEREKNRRKNPYPYELVIVKDC